MESKFEENFHINIYINKDKFNKDLNTINEKLKNLEKNLRDIGINTNFIKEKVELNRFSKKVDENIKFAFEQIIDDLSEKIMIRYLSYDKFDETPVGETGLLEDILSDKFNNTQTDYSNKDFLSLHLMNREFLTGQTPSRGPKPYYIYQHQAIKPGGPRKFRHFINKVIGSAEEVILQDEKLIIKRIKEVLKSI